MLNLNAIQNSVLEGKSLREALALFEEAIIKTALTANHYNVTETAKKLRMSRTALTYKIKRYDKNEEDIGYRIKEKL